MTGKIGSNSHATIIKYNIFINIIYLLAYKTNNMRIEQQHNIIKCVILQILLELITNFIITRQIITINKNLEVFFTSFCYQITNNI